MNDQERQAQTGDDEATGGSTMPAHTPGTRKGEEIGEREGRDDAGTDLGTTGANRPAGTRNEEPDPSGGPV